MAEILKAWSKFGEHSPRSRGQGTDSARRLRLLGAWLAVVLVFIAMLVVIAPSFDTGYANVAAGTIWNGPTVVAPFEFSVDDQEASEHARRRVEERHEKVFRLETNVEEDALLGVSALLDLTQRALREGQTTTSELKSLIQARSDMQLRDETIEVLAQNARNSHFRSDLVTILHNLYSSHGVTTEKGLYATAARSGRLTLIRDPEDTEATTLTVENVFQYPEEVFSYLEKRSLPAFALPPQVQAAYMDILRQLVKPNLSYDPTTTQMRKQAAAAAQGALKYQVKVEPGTRIIRSGEQVTPLQAAMLDKLSTKMHHYNLLKLLGSSVFVAMSIGFVLLYARKYKPEEMAFTTRNVLMVALPVLFAVSVGRFSINISNDLPIVSYAFPAAWVGMLCTVLFGARFAMVLVGISCMLFGIATGLSFAHTLVGVVGGVTGVVSLYSIRERKDVLLAGLRAALANFAAIIAIQLILEPETLSLTAPVGGILNGIVCYVLTLGALPVFEVLFHVTTDVRLMELTSINHPLLRMMEARAPGSFQHVLNVAKLAESAAEAIGANYLLVRAGAYFHDIGKILKPKYFSENQVTPEERKIHSRLSPYMSNLVIKNHVKEGMELGRRYALPDKVLEFIPQHHGTGLIKYFYSRALQKAEPNDMVHEVEFRYPGPKPQTIEAAIVMLADTVDATATAKFAGRSVKEDDLRKLIRDAIFDKFHDGQFDECHMTFRDLYKISESFVHTLMARFHHRVDYPKLVTREVRDITQAERPTTPTAAHP